MTDEPEKTPEPTPAAIPAPSAPAEPAKQSGSGPASAAPSETKHQAAPRETSGARVSDGIRASEGNRVLPLLNLAGFVILAGAIAYLWTRPAPTPVMPVIPPDQSGLVSALKGQVGNLQSALDTLDTREKQDVAALRQQIAGLPTTGSGAGGTQPAATGQGEAGDLANQIAALQGRLGKLESSEQAAAQKVQAAPSAGSVDALSGKLDSLSQREAGDTQSIRQTLAALQQQLSDLSDKAKSLAQDTQNLPQLTAQSARIGQVMQAEDALASGKPLGSIPNAPSALVKFETTPPPTEASLRLAFPAAARAAEKAGGPRDATGGFWHRVWLRVQNLVTLRQGDRVIVGDQTGGTLAHARRLLDAGDLSGAVTVLATLQGPAAEAMASWIDQAKALIAARQALADMAAH
ncbi:MAG TPA: mitofilin family membrane protein [Acidisoma sp.]|uniref:COG4223 family protein n=1 Tax=Acidisoma sp. TaxID=1872115 RepID=UPI002C90F9C4|nr:mitofilin family membrane protein [Acidisoma sp.]HTI02350.1 mitofilin family membrane protein [Acidisoma sp.]